MLKDDKASWLVCTGCWEKGGFEAQSWSPAWEAGADEGHMAHWGTSSLQRFEAEDISKPEYPVQKCQLSFSLNSKGHLKIQCFQFW